jgi:CATRA-Associated Small Protein
MIMGETGSGDAEWRAAREQAVEVLRDALEWNLPEWRWKDAGEAISDISAAVSAARLDALWRAIGGLDLCGTPRVAGRLGDTPSLPAPVAVRDRIAELVDALTGSTQTAGLRQGEVARGVAVRADEAGS